MHARNSTSLQATRTQGHSHGHDSVYVDEYSGLVEDMEPLATTGLVLRPVVPPPTRKMGKASTAAKTLAITQVELAGEGGINRVWRTDAMVDGRPVVLRIAKEARHEAEEIQEAGRIAPLIDAMHELPTTPGRAPVRPARIYGEVQIPAVYGDDVAGGAWERHATQSPSSTKEWGAAHFRTARALVMEQAEGVSLATAASLSKRERLPLAQVRDLMVGMAQWIEEGRKAGVVHTDLKTSNVMIGDGKFTLIDHTPTAVADVVRSFEPSGAGAIKGTFGYTDMHGMQMAANSYQVDHNDQALAERLGSCQLRAVAVIALECLNAGEHPVTDHPNEALQGYMGAVEPATYEHALQQAGQRYKQSSDMPRFIALLRSCIRREISVPEFLRVEAAHRQ